VYGRLQKGEAFVTVARDMSIAEDHIKGGELGWIVHGDKNATWIESVAFVQKPGTTSRPFRSPGPPGTAAVWEILKVDERIEGYQPKDSESVRYGASQALARQKALAEFRDTRERLLKSADIRINPSVIRLSKGALP
jgi:parvulin-like peptidyl-prolyl isomerase